MPWSAEDAHRHKKGLSSDQAKKWASIANSALKQYGDEGRAIRVANSQVSKRQRRADQQRYLDVFSKALDNGFPEERAHKLAWAVINKHQQGQHDQQAHAGRGRKQKKQSKQRMESGPTAEERQQLDRLNELAREVEQLRGQLVRSGTVADFGTPGRIMRSAYGTISMPVGKSHDDEPVDKHLIGRHEQKDHDPKKKGKSTGSHKRRQHGKGVGALSDTQRIGEYGGAFFSGPKVNPAFLLRASTGERIFRDYRSPRVQAKFKNKYKKLKDENPKRALKYRRRVKERTGIDVAKSADVGTYVEFTKVDEDKRQVFGWAIVSKDADGNDVIDLQGDMVAPDELEKAAYDYVLHSRDGGEMHVRKGVSHMVESFVVTPEKLSQMGIVTKSNGTGVPIGWWVGFQVNDEGVWKGVKDGKYTGFSIHGIGKRREVGDTGDLLRKRAYEELGFAVMRGDDEAVEALAKHLIGRHNQKTHSRKQHKALRSQQKSAEKPSSSVPWDEIEELEQEDEEAAERLLAQHIDQYKGGGPTYPVRGRLGYPTGEYKEKKRVKKTA